MNQRADKATEALAALAEQLRQREAELTEARAQLTHATSASADRSLLEQRLRDRSSAHG